jgi:hypothetical protein
MVFCGDDQDAKQLVATLIEDAGFRPVDAGALSMAGDLEGLARVVIETARTQGHGPFVYRFMAPGEVPGD